MENRIGTQGWRCMINICILFFFLLAKIYMLRGDRELHLVNCDMNLSTAKVFIDDYD